MDTVILSKFTLPLTLLLPIIFKVKVLDGIF